MKHEKKSAMSILYGSVPGRICLKGRLFLGLPKLMAAYLRSPLSKPMIKRYIVKYNIDMAEYEQIRYRSFAEFFTRRKLEAPFDEEPDRLISPCDSLLSVFPITGTSELFIKNSHYRISDLVGDRQLARRFDGGTCLIFRLRAQDYHHYCFIDSGFVHENRYFEGQLHSVQPIACDHFPVYRINRRCCTLMDTDHFGAVAQIEVGAMAVGEIINDYENCRVEKGSEMGHFELCGSTIVLLFEKGKIRLREELDLSCSDAQEVKVSLGSHIGYAADGFFQSRP